MSSRKEGNALRALSWPLWVIGRRDEAEKAGRGAVDVLERLPPGRELARAYGALSLLYRAVEDLEETVAWGTRALELAERLDDIEAAVHARTNIAAAEFLRGVEGGRQKLERCLELAQEAGLEEEVAAAFCYLAHGAAAYSCARPRRSPTSTPESNTAASTTWMAGDRILIARRAELELEQGRWGESADSAAQVLSAHGFGLGSIIALVTLGRLRARRGDPGQWAPLDEALALAKPSEELGRLGPVAAARAEAAWLEGDREAVPQETDAAFELAQQRQGAWLIGELAYWRWRAGVEEDVPPGAAEPYALQIAGEWKRAADLWAELGCPYEAALALADADDDDALRHALE